MWEAHVWKTKGFVDVTAEGVVDIVDMVDMRDGGVHLQEASCTLPKSAPFPPGNSPFFLSNSKTSS